MSEQPADSSDMPVVVPTPASTPTPAPNTALAARSASTVCVNHPTHPAVEHCEVCGRALCGECLWYAQTGERLCQTHAARVMAQGRAVQPPEMYADAVEVRGTASQASTSAKSAQDAPYQGNSQDLTALLAAVTGLATLFLCFSSGQAMYCMPFVALLLGVSALMSAQHAVDPARTRWLGWVGAGTGGVFVALTLVLLFFMFCGFMFIALASTAGSGRGFPTPIP